MRQGGALGIVFHGLGMRPEKLMSSQDQS